ncbi:hypothetical protein [Pyruvatibacter sp.]
MKTHYDVPGAIYFYDPSLKMWVAHAMDFSGDPVGEADYETSRSRSKAMAQVLADEYNTEPRHSFA